MRRIVLYAGAAAGLALAVPSVAGAQDVGPALDMGQLTGSLSQDHITQSERARARGRSLRGSPSRTAQTCANVPRVRARLGASDPRVQRLAQLCRQAGY